MDLRSRVGGGAVCAGALLIAGGWFSGAAGALAPDGTTSGLGAPRVVVGGIGVDVGRLVTLPKRQPSRPPTSAVPVPQVPAADVPTPAPAAPGSTPRVAEVPGSAPAPVPTQVGSTEELRPAGAPATVGSVREQPRVASAPLSAGEGPRRAPARQLPRTGTGTEALLRLSGVILVAGGASLVASRRRPSPVV